MAIANTTTTREPAHASATTVTTLQRESTPSATLRLRPEPSEQRHIQWAEDVVDNEGMGKKSSKVCCIYHKPRDVDESSDDSSSDSSDSDSDSEPDTSRAQPAGGRRGGQRRGRQPHQHDHDHDGHSHDHNQNPGEGSSKPKPRRPHRKPSPNAYEKMPKNK
ncbi:hypothetical protein M011DRAFT_495477 [Sporormia fimetaria CBS 119925]|uniref:Type 1 phosphatases regulator n=1 Tax=Sporormia fimetaria CBS 119925 TaxID=1340428 RepID=A0A6A6V6G3_9PLEO|nr:hypothetical protein M011DRAFT_495477 [Sporormia fimetaria CBS 119925]